MAADHAGNRRIAGGSDRADALNECPGHQHQAAVDIRLATYLLRPSDGLRTKASVVWHAAG